jgi:hypothetical protein
MSQVRIDTGDGKGGTIALRCEQRGRSQRNASSLRLVAAQHEVLYPGDTAFRHKEQLIAEAAAVAVEEVPDSYDPRAPQGLGDAPDGIRGAAHAHTVRVGLPRLRHLRGRCGAVHDGRGAAAVRPAWATARQAYRVLRGYCGLENAVRSVGLEEISPRLARRGDLLMVRAPRRDRPDSMRGALGICLGERIAAPGPYGLVMPPLAQGVIAWRV